MPYTLAATSISEFLTGRQVPIVGWEITEGWALFLAANFHAVVLVTIFQLAPFFFIWLERKVAGRIQDRLGPTRVGGKFGWLQSLADGIKLIQKEDLVPKAADNMLFRMAPYLAVVASYGAFMVLPFSDGWVAVMLDISLFVLLAILSLEVIAIILAGYSSGSKWSLFGGMREAAQMVSYEIPLAICGLIPIVAAGTLNLNEIGLLQAGWFGNWLIFQNPFTFLAFFVYFTVATAAVKRAPFDLAEAESELVGGFHTEYSGIRWSFFFMAEYASMFVVSAVAVYIFLGGWNIGLATVDAALFGALHGISPAYGGFLVGLVGAVVFIMKSASLVFLQIWVRWTLPRLRIDQVMMTCLKYLVPMSCFLFLASIAWPLLLVATIGRTTLIDYPESWSRPLGERIYRVPADEASGQASVLNRGDLAATRSAGTERGDLR